MLQQIECLDTRANMAANMIPIFQADNPRFDDEVFLGAAGLLQQPQHKVYNQYMR